MHKKGAEQGSRLAAQTTSLFLGGVISVTASILLLLLGSAMMLAGLLSQDKQLRLVFAACLVGAFLGGMFTGKRWEKRRLFAGAFSGLVTFLILLSIVLMGYGATIEGESGIGVLICCVCGGGIAGFVRGGSRKKQRKRGR